MGWVSISSLARCSASPLSAAILCLGKVEGFYLKPMLEMWAERQDLTSLVFDNGWEK